MTAGAGSMLPWRTARLRLTLLYVGLFLASVACLLVITFALAEQELPGASSGTVGSAAGNGTANISQQFVGLPASAISTGGDCPQPGVGPAGPQAAMTCITFLSHQAADLRGDTLDELLLYSGIALGIMAVASVGLGWLMAVRVLRPIRVITAAARRISARNLHERLAMTGPDDELKELGDTFDQLLARLEASFRAQRQFVANASHELRTPLARQRTLLEVALRDKEPTVDKLRTACERALAAGEQHERLIAAMLTLARSERGLDRFEPFDLAELAEDALLAQSIQVTGRNITVTTAFAPGPVLGDQPLAERLVGNLIDNAIRYNTDGGRLDVRTGTRYGRPFIAVTNTGVPVPADQLGRLFQPFQRLDPARAGGTAPDGHGLGLGLAIVAAIAAAHNADLRAAPEPGGGLAVEITFPARLEGADRGLRHQPDADPRPAAAHPALC
jgi:signal transduction histidine kinase